MPLVQDWSLDLLTSSLARYHCTTELPAYITYDIILYMIFISLCRLDHFPCILVYLYTSIYSVCLYSSRENSASGEKPWYTNIHFPLLMDDSYRCGSRKKHINTPSDFYWYPLAFSQFFRRVKMRLKKYQIPQPDSILSVVLVIIVFKQLLSAHEHN